MVKVVGTRNHADIEKEKVSLLAESSYPEAELLERGQEWLPMSDADWRIYERIKTLNWLLEDHGVPA